MLITSKYSGFCTACKKAIQVGDKVSWVRGVPGAKHAQCSEEGKQQAALVGASRAVDASIDLPRPKGMSYLPYQRAGIAYMLGRQSTLLADEMGLGKTVQAIGYLNASPEIQSVLVVCPASLKHNWLREFGRWSTRTLTVGLWSATPLYNRLTDVTIINYDILSKLTPQAYDLLILDEAHYVKNPKSARSKAVQALVKRAKHVLALTGTPIMNKPIELWPILQMVAPATWDPPGNLKGKAVGAGEGAGFFRFATRYCNAHQEQVSRSKTVWVFDGYSNLEELQERLRTTCMVRRLKQDVLTELPPKRRQVVTIGEDCTDLHDYDLADCYDYDRAMHVIQQIPFEEWSALRREQGIQKVEPAVEHIKSALESGSKKVVVFAHHKEVLHRLFDELVEYAPVLLTGETSGSDRDAAVQRFQTDEHCRVFVGSLKAAGVGLTLTAASHVIFVESSPVPADMTQAEDRCHRIGQRESVFVEVLILAGSIDERMAELVQSKQAVADMALDDIAPDIDLNSQRRHSHSLGKHIRVDNAGSLRRSDDYLHR